MRAFIEKTGWPLSACAAEKRWGSAITKITR